MIVATSAAPVVKSLIAVNNKNGDEIEIIIIYQPNELHSYLSKK